MQKPCPHGVGTPISPWRLPRRLTSTVAHGEADWTSGRTSQRLASLEHSSTPISPPAVHGEGGSHFLSPKPCLQTWALHTGAPYLSTRPPHLPQTQRLNWKEVILNIWGTHLRVGSRPHAWRKWQYMQLCHFLG